MMLSIRKPIRWSERVSVVVKFHFVFPVIPEPGELVWLLDAVLEWEGDRGR